jgi:5-methylcytosine-specific restriction endonuclease McrA
MCACLNIRKRQKKYKLYFYCIKYKKEIALSDCNCCNSFEIKRNKPIKKVSNKRIIVTEKTYNKVFKRDKGKCRLCGTSLNLHLHHIVYRSENKNLINEPTNCIMLCARCHSVVHSNKHYWQPKLKKMINKYESEGN